MKIINLVLLLVLIACKSTKINPSSELSTAIPFRGNAWFADKNPEDQRKFESDFLSGWSKKAIKVFFSTNTTGNIQLGLKCRVSSGKSKLKVSLNGKSETILLENHSFETIYIGAFEVLKPGYQTVLIEGLDKSGNDFAEISDLLIGGEALAKGINYVKDDFYWGRRGPSVHFKYEIPTDKNVQWIYNEITVPKENDVLGSYFMANGFGEGYFGIQVNSPTERRILFSVWSPYKTDDPNSIPEDQKIVLLKKGKDVNTGEFGNEGSGGQSFRRYMWNAGNTYRFLTRINPSETTDGSTEYTAYFFAPEIGKWELIASFRRPQTQTYARNFHSFLENFMTGTGHIQRGVSFSNQWVCDTDGIWHPISKAKYTADATARKANRIDYMAKAGEGKFYLANCGFFSPNAAFDQYFEIEKPLSPPQIDFEGLE